MSAACRIMCAWAAVSAIVALCDPAGAQSADIRDLRAGMAVDELPATGYVGLACRRAPDVALASWRDFVRCPSDPGGLHEVRARYDDEDNPLAQMNDKWEGTKVAGHPVELTLLIGDDNVVHGLRIVTDPKARLYLKKKAFLLAHQVKLHYGEEGWSCSEEPPASGESAVGGRFVKSRCEKIADHRRLVLDQQLYRRAGQSPPDFESQVQLEIWADGR